MVDDDGDRPHDAARAARSLDGVLSKLSLSRVLLIAAVLRVAWLLLCRNEPISDQVIYHESAKALAQGLGYADRPDVPANLYPVGYAALLAPFYWLLGAQVRVAYAVNVALGLAGVAGSYKLGRLLFGERVGRLCAFFMAVHPTFVMLPTTIASENAFCAGVPWLIWLLVRTVREPARALVLGLSAGALLALLVYVRPSGLPLLAAPFVFGLVERRSWRRALVPTAVVAVGAFLLLLPWGLRNRAQYGRFTVASFNGGCNLWMGNNPASEGSYMLMPEETNHLGEVERDDLLRHRALDFIREHPAKYVALTLNRVQMSLRSDTIAPTWNGIGIRRALGPGAIVALKIPCTAAHWALLLGTAVTIISVWRRRRATAADLHLGLALLLLAFPFVFIVGGNRYMLPIVPVLCVWAASGLRLGAFDEPSTRSEPQRV